MLRCPTCAFENDDFATTCVQCKSFLQNRVPNLNLFETAWGIIESPRPTFRKVTLAEHKNYSLFLYSGFGVAVAFAMFWYARLGMQFSSLLGLIPVAVGIGVVLGLVGAPLLALLVHGLARAMGSRSRFRNSFGYLAYAMVPVVISLVIVLPLELMTFGMYLFTSNPDPYVIKPVSYIMLVGFDILLGGWTVVLSVIGTSVVHSLPTGKSAGLVVVALGVLAGGFLLIVSALPSAIARI